jgi:hypothetical protein
VLELVVEEAKELECVDDRLAVLRDEEGIGSEGRLVFPPLLVGIVGRL